MEQQVAEQFEQKALAVRNFADGEEPWWWQFARFIGMLSKYYHRRLSIS
jgi:hypothetical protein